MAINLATNYPGKITVDANNPNGTFKNRTSDVLKDGTPFEKAWASDVWGFLSHILGLAGVSPSGAEENETNSQYYAALEGLVGRREVEFQTAKDLIINVTGNTTVDLDCSRISLLDSDYIPKYLDGVDVTFTMPTDLEAGTSEKNSTDYGLWLDSDGNKRLVPDLEGTTDGTIAGYLVYSGATFLTDLVHAGDIVYNLTDKTKTTVAADAVAEGQVQLTDDIFVSGEDYKIVKMSPEGLGANRERYGAVYNNSSGHFDDSWYTQIQEKVEYLESDGYFSVSGQAGFSLREMAVVVEQVFDDAGKGVWYALVDGEWTQTSSTIGTVTLTGILFDNDQFHHGAGFGNATLVAGVTSQKNSGQITVTSTSNNTVWGFSAKIKLNKKPTFHL